MSKHPSNLWSPIQSGAFQIKPCSTLAAAQYSDKDPIC